jgi:perosamine synthetase
MNIPHNQPSLNYRESRAVKKVFKSSWIAQGRKVFEFEEKICDFLGLPSGHAVALSSGSAALYLALILLNAPGKKIMIPTYTCGSILNAVKLAGARPLFLDCKVNEPNVEFIENEKLKADIFIAASIFGIPIEIPIKRNIQVIEDISQAFGSSINNIKIGTFGNVGIASFAATKLITTGGQGGILFSKDKSLIEAAKDFREFDGRHDSVARFNFQMTDSQAAVGIEQLIKFQGFIEKREELFAIYAQSGLNLIHDHNENHFQVKFRAVIRTKHAERIAGKMLERGISTIVPYASSELYKNGTLHPNARNISESTLSIPIYPNLSKKSARLIARYIMESLEIV